jgi:hypothetical protein
MSEIKAASSSTPVNNQQLAPVPLDCSKAATGVWLVKVNMVLSHY